jgi:Ca2+-binding RTX toxin-like protein
MATKIGAAGNDALSGTGEWDTLYGLAGNDTLNGNNGDDILSGGEGNDILAGGLGADALNGGAGADTFKYTAFNQASSDRIVDFGAGDRIDFSAVAGHKFIGNAQFSGVAGQIRYISQVNSSYTYIQIDSDGDSESDISLTVNGKFSFIETAANSGILIAATSKVSPGTAAGETLTGGAGNDNLSGAGGNDTLVGGEGHDRLSGGDGNDTLVGGLGTDRYTGGAGADIFRFDSADEVNGDTITDFSGASNDNLALFKGLSFIGDGPFSKTSGEYRYNTQSARLDFDGDGDGAAEKYVYITGYNGQLEETAAGSNLLRAAVDLTLPGTAAADTLTGKNGNDTVSGLAGNDILTGGRGDDHVSGGDGNDTLIGGTGNDTLMGDGGNDILSGGVGQDILAGGLGADTFKFATLEEIGGGSVAIGYYGVGTGDTITDVQADDKIDLSALAGDGLAYVGLGNDFTGVAGQVMARNGSYSYASTYLDIDVDGDETADYSLRLTGKELAIEETVPGSLIFRIAPDLNIKGTANSEVLKGGNGNDTVTGLGGNDTLSGGYGIDYLDGGDGNDILAGGLGKDTLIGGAGADTFKFASLAEIGGGGFFGNSDRITDLAAGDKVDLSAIAGLSFAGVGNGFSGKPNEVKASSGYSGGSSSDTTLEVDIDGDKDTDYTLSLAGSNLVIEEATAGSGIFQVAPDKTVNGTANSEVLKGGNGNDTISGLVGNDQLFGGYGRDMLDGGDGADVLVGGLGYDQLSGGTGNDAFKFASLAEIGSGGYDSSAQAYVYETITDLAVGDKVDLSAIAGLSFVGIGQEFSGKANQVQVGSVGLSGNATALQIDTDGDKDEDFILAISGANLTIEETTAGSGIFQIAEDKVWTGTASSEVKAGGNGNDTLNGAGGNDNLSGAYGNDKLDGGDGADVLNGGLGLDTLTGGTGNDAFKFAALAEIGSGGYDFASQKYVYETITDLAAGDKIDLSAIAGLSFVGIDQEFSGKANQVQVGSVYLGLAGNATALQIDTDGDEDADFTLAIQGADLAIEETAAGSKIFQLVVDKTITGTNLADVKTGGNGNDTISGLGGNDTLSGAYGNDKLDGGDGADVLNGGLGLDTLTGGTGNDAFKFAALAEIGSGGYDFASQKYVYETITDLAAGDKIDLSAIAGLSFVGIDQEFSGKANQVQVGSVYLGLSGNATALQIDTDGDKDADFTLAIQGADLAIEETAAGSRIFQLVVDKTITGTNVADVKAGGNGNDTISGLGGNDILSGGYGNDKLDGGDGNDTLKGEAGKDDLIGGNGDDVLIGGPGADTLDGGAGKDTFKFASLDDVPTDYSSSAPYQDTIAQFETGDKIDLSGIDANAGVAGDQAFSFVSNFSGAAGELRYQFGSISGDANGDFSPDFTILVTSGPASWAATDFVL